MNELITNLMNGVATPIITFLVGAICVLVIRALWYANGSKIGNIVSTISENEQLRAIAKNLCIYAQKYVSEVAIDKINYVIKQLENYCKQCGLKITKDQVIEIAQNTYDEYRTEISNIEFVKDLEKILKDHDNNELKNKKGK